MRLGLVTSRDVPLLSTDDQPLLPLLRQRGIHAEPVRWDEAQDLASFDALVVRSTWDYHRRYPEFEQWLAHVEAMRLPLWNPASTIRWNATKTYLKDLARHGARVVPTLWHHDHAALPVIDKIDQHGWRDIVLKPTRSASGENTLRLRDNEINQLPIHLNRFVDGWMVQPFIEQVRREGEWSLVYFAETFSHAVIKRPAPKEFRVQEEHGGSTQSAIPPQALIASANLIAQMLPKPWLFARIDGFADDASGELIVAEVEMIEPLLFLSHHPGSARRFAEAITTLLNKN